MIHGSLAAISRAHHSRSSAVASPISSLVHRASLRGGAARRNQGTRDAGLAEEPRHLARRLLESLERKAVPGAGQEDEPRAGNRLHEPPRVLHRDELVGVSRQGERRDADLPEPRRRVPDRHRGQLLREDARAHAPRPLDPPPEPREVAVHQLLRDEGAGR